MPELLFELFSEEIPARMQARAADDLKRLTLKGLAEAGVGHGEARTYVTPRRLTLVVEGVEAETQAVREELKGPRTDAPEKALEGFLRKTGLSKDQLETRDDKKGQVYFAVIEKPGRRALDVAAEVAPEVIRGFPWPKSQRWGAGELRWVRPLRSVLCVLAENGAAEVAKFSVGDLESGDVTYGHRFLAADPKTGQPKPIAVTGFADYETKLAKAKVMLDPEARAALIEKGAAALAAKEGLEISPDPALLREVAGLVEHPVVLMGSIDERFQKLPAAVLKTSMREHQKFFSAVDPKTGVIPRFVTVANIETADDGATIIAGNERVLRARLADAEFFYHNDLSKPLESYVDKLASVTFHNRLGSQAQRITRLRALARHLAPLVGADAEQADRAALLAKADLATEMVYEFPELQGQMGRIYAAAGDEAPAVAQAIEAHYAPAGPSDDAPTDPVAIAVALADKIDSLACFWAIDAKPTGSGDPFALRRAALGVIRTILENGLRLHLSEAFADAAARVEADALAEGDKLARFSAFEQADLLGFFADRLKVWLREQGVRHDVIDAVYNLPALHGGAPGAAQDDLVLVRKRIDALSALVGSEDGANLLAAYKRANNILAAEEKKDGVEYSLDPQEKLAEEDAEKALFKALDAADQAIAPALKSEDFAAAAAAMAALRQPLDAFFDQVVVNAENQVVRRNRLCLLHRIRQIMGKLADFSAIEG